MFKRVIMSDFQVGDKVNSITFGKGVVTGIIANKICPIAVNFENGQYNTYSNGGKLLPQYDYIDLYHGHEPIVVEPRTIPCRLKVGDWALVTKPKQRCTKPSWVDSMEYTNGTVQQIKDIQDRQYGTVVILECNIYTYSHKWLTKTTKPISELPVDTKMIVWNDSEDIKGKRCFSHFDEKGRCFCFINGKMSWTTNATSCWDNFEVVEDD